MSDQLLTILNEYFPLVALAAVVLVGMLLKCVREVACAYTRERSRREIAAYIAEGSMNPEQGERLIRASVNSHSKHHV